MFGFYKYYNLTDDKILETRNYDNVYGKECTRLNINNTIFPKHIKTFWKVWERRLYWL